MSKITHQVLDGMVRTRISNLVITGDAANHGNFSSWRRFTISAAEILGFTHITEQITYLASESSKEAPLLLDSDSSDSDSDSEDKPQTKASSSSSSSSSTRSTSSSSPTPPSNAKSIRGMASTVDELQKNLQRVLSIYAFNQTGGYLLDDHGHKVRWKQEHAPEISSIEKELQNLGMKIVACEIVGEAAVGNWPDEDPELSADMIPSQFTCAICKLLLYQPVSTNCGHNFCKSCLSKWMAKKKHTCPVCRNNIAKKWRMPINKSIHNALKSLYPKQVEARRIELNVEADEEEAEAASKLKRRRNAPGATDENGKTICQNCGHSVTRITLHRQYCEGPAAKRMRTNGKQNSGRRRRSADDDNDETSSSSSSSSTTTSSSSSIHKFQIMRDPLNQNRIIGVSDDTAILHLPNGITHMAKIELQRLSRKTDLTLKMFHPQMLANLKNENIREIASNENAHDGQIDLVLLETVASSWKCSIM